MVRTGCDAIIYNVLGNELNVLSQSHHGFLSSCMTDEDSSKKVTSRCFYNTSQGFLGRVDKELSWSLNEKHLLELSNNLKIQYYESLQNPNCMLPSFNYHLPTGNESGKFIAVDLGGSTLRVAFIQLSGSDIYRPESEILSLKAFKITPEVKNLSGHSFFNWMAARIEETLRKQDVPNTILHMGVSWSFPLEQTSHRNGLLMKMGKGFSAADPLLKQDLADLIQDSCKSRGLSVHLDAITNDSSATLLAKAYSDNATVFSLVLGTGVNIGAHLPAKLFPTSKLGSRPPEWYASAKHILVNTEISMIGKSILPETTWDIMLKNDHQNPDHQPFEHLVSGRYIGEIIRLILIDGIQTEGFFGGIVPPSLREKYSLETETISLIESDQSFNQQKAYQIFCKRHPSIILPTKRDILALRFISSRVVCRASGLVAAAIYALWRLRNEANNIAVENYIKSSVACTGSVIEFYPGFKAMCQEHLDSLLLAGGASNGTVQLVSITESSLIGAAVASAVSLS
ncbi:Hexokinase-1 [Erysiphe neolycopersici]|uniref:Phosphotransferase n=1 Tax=Erysiphe neolycopersici TaxID=212602 RepID=A0A420HMP0_9PEZI|nr:Hexokinase-1 [Erysiphe neolycopersici]